MNLNLEIENEFVFSLTVFGKKKNKHSNIYIEIFLYANE